MVTGNAFPTRKLAAILMADVVGYSRLMGEDEAGTLSSLRDHREQVVDPLIRAYHGRMVKLMGDGALVEFPSVLEAVACALKIQEGMRERNRGTPGSKQIQFRIGINLSDVIVEGDDIHGDGVNITARLETLAEPGGVCISGMVHEALGNKLPLQFEFIGEKNVKNISEPVRTFHVTLKPGASLPEMSEPAAGDRQKWSYIATIAAVALAILVAYSLVIQPRPPEEEVLPPDQQVSIESKVPVFAVLPFTNMSGDPGQDYFSDGISEDIITDLSQLSNLKVVARSSSFAFKSSTEKIDAIAAELGARYILQGSVRRSGDRVRVTAQLVDTDSGHHLWADRYDRRLIDFFELQDDIRSKIVSALSIKLADEENEHLLRKETNSFEAYDLFLQGRRLYGEYSRESLERAVDLYRQAIELDPDFARAYGAHGIATVRRVTLLAPDNAKEQLDLALTMAQKAVAIEPKSPQAQWALGFVYMWREEYEPAAEAVHRAVALFPNYSDGWGLLSLINNQLGRGDQALRFVQKGMELNPGYSFDFPYNEGRAYYTLGEYEKAVEALLAALERNENAVNPRLYLAASYVRLNRVEDAEWEITQAAMINPSIAVANLDLIAPMAEGDHKIRFVEDMRKAGLPD